MKQNSNLLLSIKSSLFASSVLICPANFAAVFLDLSAIKYTTEFFTILHFEINNSLLSSGINLFIGPANSKFSLIFIYPRPCMPISVAKSCILSKNFLG